MIKKFKFHRAGTYTLGAPQGGWSSTIFLPGWLSRSWRDIREWSGITRPVVVVSCFLIEHLLVSLFSTAPQLDKYIPVDCCLLAPLFFNPRATWSLSLIFCLLIEKHFMCLFIPRTTWSGTCRGTRRHCFLSFVLILILIGKFLCVWYQGRIVAPVQTGDHLVFLGLLRT